MKNQILFEPSEKGDRLKYFRESADSDYWDALWLKEAQHHDYTRAAKGHIPNQLRRTFQRWVAPPSSVLEAGCGLASFTVAASSLGYNAVGLDWAPQTVSMLRSTFPHIPFLLGDVRNLTNIPACSYDSVYSPGVCEHFETGPNAILSETYRVLKPGGIAVISTPCLNRIRRLIHRFGGFRDTPRGEFYQYAFTQREIDLILQGIGFEVVQHLLYGTLKTLMDHFPFLEDVTPKSFRKPLAVALDRLPIVRRWGHSCIWVARKP